MCGGVTSTRSGHFLDMKPTEKINPFDVQLSG